MSVTIVDNGFDPVADLEKLRGAFDLRGDGLGSDLLNAALDGVAIACAAGRDSDGQPWPKLSEAYALAKAKAFPGQPIGRREGVMLSDENLRGERHITKAEATMTYGQTDRAKDEASWFVEGDSGRGRPPREFYALTGLAIDRADKILDERFDRLFD